MSLTAYNAAGYAPVPLRGGRPAVAGVFSNNPSWRYAHGEDARFADCDVGLLCSARPLSGASGPATLAACSSTWIAGIRWETSDRKLSTEISTLVDQTAGVGPTRIEGAETLRIFKVDQPFVPRRLTPVYFPKERYRELTYRPHRLEALSLSAFIHISGGTWARGALPDVHRDQLPTLTSEQTDSIVAGVEKLFNQRGGSPWR
jgi:hypothetical protein